MIGPAHPNYNAKTTFEDRLMYEATRPLDKKIISAVGYARTGKDEFSKIAVEEFGYTRFAFADKLRECVYALNPLVIKTYKEVPRRMMQKREVMNAVRQNGGSRQMTMVEFDFPPKRLQDVIDEYGWNGYKESLYGSEIRQLLQRFGTEVGRDLIDQDIWLKELDKVDSDKIVITDTRFPNELDYVRAKGGKIVRIHRTGFGPINEHISEIAIDSYGSDFTILNSGTLEEYADKIRSAIRIIESS